MTIMNLIESITNLFTIKCKYCNQPHNPDYTKREGWDGLTWNILTYRCKKCYLIEEFQDSVYRNADDRKFIWEHKKVLGINWYIKARDRILELQEEEDNKTMANNHKRLIKEAEKFNKRLGIYPGANPLSDIDMKQ